MLPAQLLSTLNAADSWDLSSHRVRIMLVAESQPHPAHDISPIACT